MTHNPSRVAESVGSLTTALALLTESYLLHSKVKKGLWTEFALGELPATCRINACHD